MKSPRISADNYHDAAGVLFNLLGITDGVTLREYDLLASEIYAPAALAFAEQQPTLNMDTLSGIHRLLFQDLYVWAGQLRTVPLHKGTSKFTDPQRIPGWLDNVMPQFERAASRTQDISGFRPLLAELWGRINVLHPFPEGNGRATQMFITAVAHRHGYDLDWSCVKRSDELRAGEASMHSDFYPYRAIVLDALGPWDRTAPPSGYYPTR